MEVSLFPKPMQKNNKNHQGFTLIEVLLALVIIAISLTALLRATGQDLRHTYLLREKSIQHWVAWQAVAMIQANMITLKKGPQRTYNTNVLNQEWYWRPRIIEEPIKGIKKFTISLSNNQSGPFIETLTAYTLEP